MNGRITELAVKANDQTGNKFDLNYKELDAFLEKFAELIVRECAGIVYQTCRDGDAGAQAILYEFDIDNARSQK
jgi:hypothetical protein